MASIREFGFAVPVLARSTGEVVDGHLRLKAARKLGMTEVPVIPCDGWTDAQVKAFRLMVNRSVSWADWDLEPLAAGVRRTAGAGLRPDADRLRFAGDRRLHAPRRTQPKTTCHRFPKFRSRARVICGCAGRTAYCAATLPARPM